MKNEVPTVTSLFKKIKNDGIIFPYKRSTLHKLLQHMGFQYQVLNKRQAIMETPRLLSLRMDYTQQIKKYRSENRQIFYLDETWYDSHDVVRKGFIDKSGKCFLTAPPSRGKRIIILHAGSESGWVPGALLLSAKNIKTASADYHEDMSAKLFEDWFVDQLIPNLPPKSVIVMDNASYHSRQPTKIPNTGSRKEEIMNFLRLNYVPLPEKIKKKELLNILKEIPVQKKFFIDETAKTYNHDVLRLPPYYCVLNPIELVWSQLKRKIRTLNTSSNWNGGVVDVIREAVNTINADSWKAYIEHVKKIETDYLPILPVNKVVINLGNSSDDDDELF